MYQSGTEILDLGRKRRRKLWIIALLGYAHLPLSWIALVIFIGGVIHQLLMELSPYLVLLVACLPQLPLALLALKKRPTVAEAVTQTDLYLKAHSLFITAWESSQPNSSECNMQSLIAARAKQQLPRWHKHLKRQVYPKPKTPLLIAFAFTIIGGMLLALPGKPTPLTHNPMQINKNPQSIESPNPVAMINQILLQESPEATAERLQNTQDLMPDTLHYETHASDSATDLQKLPETETVDDLEDSQPLRDTLDSNQRKTQQSNMTERHRTGRSSGTDSPETAFSGQVQATPFQQQVGFEIEIRASDSPKARSFNPHQGSQLADSDHTWLHEATTIQMTSTADSMGSQPMLIRLSAEQRALVTRYFDQLSQLNDTTR